MLALQVVCYAEAKHLEYRAVQPMFMDGTPMSFTTYYDLTTRSMSLSRRGGRGEGQPLGAWGYAFRVLEVLGFAVGGLIPSLTLMGKPFCETCQVYMKTKSQGFLPAGVIPRKIKKNDAEEQQVYSGELKAAFENGLALMQTAFEHAQQANAPAFRECLAQHKPQQKEIQKQTTRIDLQLNYCPRCSAGHLKAINVSGFGEEISQQEIRVQEVDPQFVRGCLEIV